MILHIHPYIWVYTGGTSRKQKHLGVAHKAAQFHLTAAQITGLGANQRCNHDLNTPFRGIRCVREYPETRCSHTLNVPFRGVCNRENLSTPHLCATQGLFAQRVAHGSPLTSSLQIRIISPAAKGTRLVTTVQRLLTMTPVELSLLTNSGFQHLAPGGLPGYLSRTFAALK